VIYQVRLSKTNLQRKQDFLHDNLLSQRKTTNSEAVTMSKSGFHDRLGNRQLYLN